MAFIGRMLAIFFGFLAACFVAGLVVVVALLLPEMVDEMTDLSLDQFDRNALDHGALNVILGIGFMVVSGFALLPALIAVLITETFSIRHILAYAVAGGIAGLCCYLVFIPFDTVSMTFTGVVQRHLEVMTGAGILGGVVYWMIAGRNAGRWRKIPSQAG